MDDDDYDRGIPFTRRCTGEEGLIPPAPEGWWAVTSYTTDTTPEPLDIATWFYAVDSAQCWSQEAGRRLHRVVRDPHGRRMLLVHPDLSCQADELIETVNAAITQCNCGGYDCLFSNIQVAGSRTFAKRAWARLSTARRMELAEEYHDGEEIGVDILGAARVLDDVDDASLLYRLAEEAADRPLPAEALLDDEQEQDFRRAA